jgi:hypothetical protein
VLVGVRQGWCEPKRGQWKRDGGLVGARQSWNAGMELSAERSWVVCTEGVGERHHDIQRRRRSLRIIRVIMIIRASEGNKKSDKSGSKSRHSGSKSRHSGKSWHSGSKSGNSA